MGLVPFLSKMLIIVTLGCYLPPPASSLFPPSFFFFFPPVSVSVSFRHLLRLKFCFHLGGNTTQLNRSSVAVISEGWASLKVAEVGCALGGSNVAMSCLWVFLWRPVKFSREESSSPLHGGPDWLQAFSEETRQEAFPTSTFPSVDLPSIPPSNMVSSNTPTISCAYDTLSTQHIRPHLLPERVGSSRLGTSSSTPPPYWMLPEGPAYMHRLWARFLTHWATP